jgi:hypothetical protein
MTEEPDQDSAMDELRLAFGRAIGFTVAAVVLLIGGAVLLFLVAAVFFRFAFGG